MTGKVVRELTTSTNHPNTHDVTPDQDLKETADYWTGYADNRGATRIGRQTATFTRTLNSMGESTMGNLAADWALWAGAQNLDPFDTGNIYPNVPADLALIALAPAWGPASSTPTSPSTRPPRERSPTARRSTRWATGTPS